MRRLLLAVPAAIALAVALAVVPAAAGSWVWPLPPPPRVVRGFHPPAQPWLPGHRGVDLAGAAGERVVAAGAGVVVVAGRVAGTPVVAIRHPDGLETTYEPVVAAVRRGDRVTAGSVIGRLRAGGHCGVDVCLHWGLRRGLDYLDPLGLVGAQRVRLLPMSRGGLAGTPAAGAALGAAAVVGCAFCRWPGRTRA